MTLVVGQQAFDIEVADRTALDELDTVTAVVLIDLLDIDQRARIRIAGAFGNQLLDLVAVHREVEGRGPREIAPCVLVSGRSLDTPVIDLAGVDVFLFVAGAGRCVVKEELVVGVGIVVGSRSRDLVAQELDVETGLERLGALGFEVLGRGDGRRAHHAVGQRVVGTGDVTFGSIAHLGIGSAHLEERDARLREVGHRRNHGRKAHRRIEDVLFGREGQHRGPVVADRNVNVEHTPPAQLHGRIHGLNLVVVVLLRRETLRVVGDDVVVGELVGNARQITFVTRQLVLVVHDAGAEVELQGEGIVEEALVDAQQHVAVEVVVRHRAVQVAAVLRSEERVGRSAEFAGVVDRRIIGTDTARQAHPVGDVELHRSVEAVAVLTVFVQLAVGDPPRVLDALEEFEVPELLHIARVGTRTLVNLVFADVVAAREEVDAHQRVAVLALNSLVAGVLLHVGRAHVERQAVLDKHRRIADREIVAVVDIVGYDTARIDGGSRRIGLVAFGTGGKAHRVGLVESGLEEIRGIVRSRRGEFAAPAHHRLDFARAVGVLEFGHHEGMGEGRRVRIVDPHAALLALLGGDEDHTVGALSPVEGRSRGTRKDRHGLDVVGVDVRHAVRPHVIALQAVVIRAEADVRHRNTVDHIEGVVVLVERFGTAHYHAGRAADARRRGVDLHTGDLAVEGIHEVGVLNRNDVLGFHLLDVVRERLFLTFDTEGRHHHVIQRDGRFDHRDTEIGAASHSDLLRFAAQIIDHEHRVLHRSGNLQSETAVDIGADTDRRTFDNDRRADNGLSVCIEHHTRDIAQG